MEAINDILVPAFVNEVLAMAHCEYCEARLDDAWIQAAGIRLDAENTACFFASVMCKSCEAGRDFFFKSRPFMREEWWQDIACWVGDTARPDRVHMVLSNLRTLPDVHVLYRERVKVHRLDLVGAYAGEAGPVIFLFHKFKAHPSKTYGVLRLERKDRLRFLSTGEREALPVSRWLWFAGLSADTTFHSRGREWRKLSVDRIRDIVSDRVFERWLGRRGRTGK